jgi:hypothetical protein
VSSRLVPLAIVLFLAACEKQEPPPAETPPPAPPPAVTTAAPAATASAAAASDLPTAEDFEEEAAKEITAANLDAQLDALEKEINAE